MYSMFWDLIKYKFYLDMGYNNLEESAEKIRIQAENLNPVWQKFFQTLACRDDIIGDVLALELRKLLDKCPIHEDKITMEIIKEEMDDEKFSTELCENNIIGSGTIAQVYKAYSENYNKWVAVKIKHPKIKENIEEAYLQYKSLSDSYWFPSNIKFCCDEFFNGLRQQEDFEKEFNSGNAMSELLKNISEDKRLFIIPKMLKYSPSIIIMDYEPGAYSFVNLPNDEIKQFISYLMINYQVISIYNGLLHSDLHWGNFSVKLDPLKIILYDFGWVVDMLALDVSSRKTLSKVFLNRDPVGLFNIMLGEMDIPLSEKEHHANNINNIINDMKPGELFSNKIKNLLIYYQSHNLSYNKYLIAIIYACIHCEQLEKVINQNNLTPPDLSALLLYPEFSALSDLI